MIDRRLILFRHGKSAWPQGITDHARPLADRGRVAVPLMADWLARTIGKPDMAIVSSATRTQQTFAHIAPSFPDLGFRTEPRVYEANAESLIAILRELPDSASRVLIVGHNPGMQELSLVLSGTTQDDPEARARLKRKFPTAGIAVLDIVGPWREVSPGFGRLAHFTTPAMLGGIDED